MLRGIMTRKAAFPDEIDRLLTIMARLRDPGDGCPWDLAQTFESIAPYTIEEAYEVAEAIRQADMAALKDELGDLLLQVVFHARMAEEQGDFDFHEVARAISDKMVRRHPHVFGGQRVADAAAQTLSWEALKAAERKERAGARGDQDPSVLEGVAVGLPALTRAEKLQRRAARVGFDWPEADQVLEKIEEEISEIRAELANDGHPDRLEDEVGDLLFAVANLARHLGVDAEAALRRGNAKFERRFKQVEAAFGGDLDGTGLEDMEAAWQEAKKSETREG
jgi:MazG family protein